MLSKGGKIISLCPACDNPAIFNTRKGMSLQGKTDYMMLPKNHWFCGGCLHYGPWSSRKRLQSHKAVDIATDDMLGVGDYAKLANRISEIKLWKNEAQSQADREASDKLKIETGVMTDPNISYERPKPPIESGDITQLGIEWSPEGKEDYTHWTHRPDDFGVWVAYNSWRFKDTYDVMLKDGTIHKCCYPNADAFHSEEGVQISEYDVLAVKLCTFEDLGNSWRCFSDTEEESNAYRAERNAEMFGMEGRNTPTDWKHVEPVEFDPETKKLKPKKLQLHGVYGNQVINRDGCFTTETPQPLNPDIGRGHTTPMFHMDHFPFTDTSLVDIPGDIPVVTTLVDYPSETVLGQFAIGGMLASVHDQQDVVVADLMDKKELTFKFTETPEKPLSDFFTGWLRDLEK
tara:strand:+ start:56534 stop:57739 length:1206 start_codon:yes stop_codon:yes gene_type:complete